MKILWVDNLKAYLIMMVLVGHLLYFFTSDYISSHLFNYIYSFHMPLFMLISGFLSYKEVQMVKWEVIRRRSIQLLIPYFVWTFAFCYVEKTSLYYRLYETPVYWFLILLFLIIVLMTLCQKISVIFGWKPELLCFIMFFLLFLFHKIFKPGALCLNVLYVHFFFYSVGWYMRKNEEWMIQKWIIVPSGLLFVIVGYFYVHSSSPSMSPSFPPSLYYIITGIVGSSFFINAFSRFCDYDWKWIRYIGNLTLGIYVIHLLLCYYFSTILPFYCLNTWISLLLMFVGVAASSVFICFILGKNKISRYVIGK